MSEDMVQAVPNRTYKVVIMGATDPGMPIDALARLVAPLIGRSNLDVEAMWTRLPYTVARGLSPREARQLELSLQRVGIETRAGVDSGERDSLSSLPPATSMRPKPSELAAAERQPPDAQPTRILAYVAVAFTVAALLMLLR